MSALVLAVFLASVLGSLHCAGMCGAFLAIAVAPAEGRRGAIDHVAMQSAYHGGRLITYVVLGAIAGSLGSVLDLGGSLVGVQRVAAALAAVTIIAFGLVTLLRTLGVGLPRMPLPPALRRASIAVHRRAMSLPGVTRAGVIGLATTLLPCGWLYAFVVTAAGTGGAGSGALVMAVFWLGTLPLMVSLGAGLRSVSGVLGRRLPAITASVLVLVGILSLTGRADVIGTLLPRDSSVHGGVGPAAAIERVNSIDSSKVCPLCDPK